MKWKILIKLLYLITVLSLLGIDWSDHKSKLIDSDPQMKNPSVDHGNFEA